MGKADCKVQLCEIYQAIKELWKKTIDMVTISMLGDPNNEIIEIYIKSKSIGLYDSRYPDDLSMPYDVGGIEAGTTAGELRWSNLTEMMDELLFPIIEPYIDTPQSVILNKVASNDYYEVGELLGIELRAVFDKGLIKNGDNSNGPSLVGNANNYQFTGTSISTPIDDVDGFYSMSVIIELSMNRWNVEVFYDEGVGQYFDSKGTPSNILDPQRAAGSIDGLSPEITGVYPFFHGMNDQDLETGGTPLYLAMNKKIVPKSNEVVLPVNDTSKYIYFAYPSSYGLLSIIRDGSGFDVTASFDQFTANIESVGLGQNYVEECHIYKTKSLTSVSPSQDYKLIF